MIKGDTMTEARSADDDGNVSVPKQVWNKYRYLTVYATVVSTILLVLQIWRH
jgi:hypothetical protein